MMSKDRVVFTIPPSEFKKNKGGYKEALELAFGDPYNTDGWDGMIENHYGLTIRCRPSQFARFLIHRNDVGVPNSFQALNPRLEQEQDERVFDVSKNPNQYWKDR
jgi:hypothetical protein